MSNLSLRCMRAAFLALAAGVALGAWFAVDRAAGAWLRPLHAELNLWGWATLLIYGMGYHMLPRFAGRPLVRTRLATVQSWLAIAGVALVALGWLLTIAGWALARVVVFGGGAAQIAAAALFSVLIAEILYVDKASPHTR